MRIVWIIFKKELLDTLRDRRTLAVMLLVPLFLLPLIIALVTQLQAQLIISARAPLIRVGLVEHGNASDFEAVLRAQPDVYIVKNLPASGLPALIRQDSIDAAFVISPDFDAQVGQMEPGAIQLFYEADINVEVNRRRLREIADQYAKKLAARRVAAAGIDPGLLEPILLEETNVSRKQRILGQIFGGILPYFFIIFCYLGAMYPAIDLAAGEKERHTMETLLTTPASRFEIVLGKFWVVVLCGVASGVVSIVGLYLGLLLVRQMPPELYEALAGVLHPARVSLLALLLVPLSMFFAGLMLTLSVFARSFKEAQSILSPLAIITVLPAVVGLLPGLHLNARTALFPMLNVSIAMKEIIAGTAPAYGLFLVLISLSALAAVSLYICSLYFRREEVIFRS